MKNVTASAGRKNVTAPADVAGGDVWVGGAMIGIYFGDYLSGAAAVVAIDGDVIALDAKSDDVWADGDQLYWHPSNLHLTDDPSGAVPAGKARGAKADTVATADLHLNR